MRIGEAVGFERDDLDSAEAVITIRHSKFAKSRLVPLEASTAEALASYAQMRDRLLPRPRSTTFFLTIAGSAVLRRRFRQNLPQLARRDRHRNAGHRTVRGFMTSATASPSRRCSRGIAPARTSARSCRGWPPISVIGIPCSTFWYLSAHPELLALAARRLEAAEERAS